RHNIDIERSVVSGAAFLSLFGYGVMSGRERNPKLSLLIRGKGCDFRSLFVLCDESGIRKGFRTGSARPDWPRLSWAKRNYSFYPRFCSGRSLPGRNANSHNEEPQNQLEYSKSHQLTYGDSPIRVNNDEPRMSKHKG